MNVIGIVQTDLNEFNILFAKEDQWHGHQEEGNQSGLFEDLFGGGGNGGQENLQEMTVRIKGVPEGQRANFLQMYQIIQDAREMDDLERNLTIVSRGDDQRGCGSNPGSGGRSQ